MAGTRSLDGSGNNRRHPSWGQANTPYLRVARAATPTAAGTMVAGPDPPLRVSNRIFNDESQNLFSENGVTQWGFVWGQFLDHTFGLRQDGGEPTPLALNAADPLESFADDDGSIGFVRTPAAPQRRRARHGGREQLNTVSGYIDASAVYGDTELRLDWLRDGPLDGDPTNNAATLLLADGMLPRRDARGDVATAPEMTLNGPLMADPAGALVAGDVRANENIALAAVHTLFAREHNRIVSLLPDDLPEQERFEIARRVVGAEQQFVTYEEFLPRWASRWRRLAATTAGSTPGSPTSSPSSGSAPTAWCTARSRRSPTWPITPQKQLAAIEAEGVEVVVDGDEVEFVIPQNIGFGNPELLLKVGVDPIMVGLGAEPQYRNDEQIDNQLRSVLFQLPATADPACLDGPTLPQCYQLVADLGAIDIQRGRDHGIPSYNELRRAFGLAPRSSFTEVTGEATEAFPDDPEIDAANPLADPDILDFVSLADAGRQPDRARQRGSRWGGGDRCPPHHAGGSSRRDLRRCRRARRLRRHGVRAAPAGLRVGRAATRDVEAAVRGVRDGDRFFHLHDPVLAEIEQRYGISFRHTLAELIELNTDADVSDDVFRV